MNIKMKRRLLASAVALACGNASGAEYWLCSGTFDKTMPDNSVVRMWGYADVSDTTTYPGHACPASGDAAYTSPGPQLNIPVADSGLTVHLQNTLDEPTSLVIPGQTETNMIPVMIGNRVRSFTHEAPAAVGGASGTDDYIWNNLKPGSYAYQTGTHPAKQVQMGLYGAMVKNAAANTAYPGITYDTEVVEFLSEIDPLIHSRVATGSYGTACADPEEQKANPCTSTIGYNPKWFLVNGNVFVDSSPAAPATIPSGKNGETTLIRFFNMGLRSHNMVLNGEFLQLIAEDGHVMPDPHDQYSVMIAAGKTHDVLFEPEYPGQYALYERMHNLSTSNGAGNIKTGGLVSFLEVGAGELPVAFNDAFLGNEDTAIIGNVLSNDQDGTVPAETLTAELVSGPAGFSLLSDGSFNYVPAVNFNGILSFTYRANDGTNQSNVATALLKIAAVNDPPVIDSAAVTTATEGQPYNYNVAASDADTGDTPPQTLSYLLLTAPTGMTIDAASGAISWTPGNDQAGNHDVTVRVTDSGSPALSAEQSFSITVANANNAPTLAAITSPQNAVVGSLFSLTAVGSDLDAGDTLTYSLTSAPAWLSINPTSGVLSGTPTAGDVGGPFTVTVRVTDSSGAANDFAEQSFTMNVTAATGAQTVYFSTLSNTNPRGLMGRPDDADIYSWNGTAFSRVVNMANSGGETTIANAIPTGANVDELKFTDATHFYVSFVNNTTLPSLGNVQDEDIVFYNNGTWSVFFNGTDPDNNPGTANGLTNNNHDIDAFDLSGSSVYFSTSGGTTAPTATNPPGVTGTADNADIYAWNGTAFSRLVDLSTIGVPAAPSANSNSNVDGLKFVDSTHFYLSFAGNVTLTNPVGGGTLAIQDEDIVFYNNGTWSVFFNGTDPDNNPGTANGLTENSQDIDGFDIVPLP
jgi:FtsP/CotA-like multicopper oxidase with cupredoxin domain